MLDSCHTGSLWNITFDNYIAEKCFAVQKKTIGLNRVHIRLQNINMKIIYVNVLINKYTSQISII